MTGINLSAWALANRGLVVYAMVLLALAGVWSYSSLGQSEDPPFTFPVTVVRAYWPGATATEVAQQLTDRIEEKLQEHEQLDHLTSYSRPGESQVFFIVKEDRKGVPIEQVHYQVRKKINDIRFSLPEGVIGPFFNDEFGDTFGNIYALTGKDFSYRELEDYAEKVRKRLLSVKDVAKVEFFGLQNEIIEVRVANTKRAGLGIPPGLIFDAIQSQNAVTAAGFFEVDTDRIYMRVTGGLRDIDDIRNTPINFNGRTFRVADVAEVHRGYSDPQQPMMRFKGENSIGIGVSMKKGGDIIVLGRALNAQFEKIQATLPAGLALNKVADQPEAVKRGVGEFLQSLTEAVVIVLLVSFFSLGWRSGLVVALSIPLVLAATFAAMKFYNIDLHKISLGSLVLALGLLVDDAIIAVEMMAIKMEQGMDRMKAAAYAYTTTAFPMLSGTIVTAAGFLPIAMAASTTGEYTRSIFQVVTIALLISWVAAVIFVPYLGFKILPDPKAGAHENARDPYQSKFYVRFRRWVEWCVRHRWTVIVATVGLFAVSIVGLKFVPQLFFPPSARLELLVDLRLPEGASLQATDRAAQQLEAVLVKETGLRNYAVYVGSGSPRFYLPLDQQLTQAGFAQFVLTAETIEDRERIRQKLLNGFPTMYPDVITRVLRLENGPPVGYQVQYRVRGEDRAVLQDFGQRLLQVMHQNPHLASLNLDWGHPSKVVRLVIDQDRARALGVSTQSVAQFMQTALSGGRITYLRENNQLIEVQLRGPVEERVRLSLLESTAIPRGDGTNIPLNQIARIEHTFEDGIIWRRDRQLAMTARADIRGSLQPSQVVAQLAPEIDKIRAQLPPDYSIELGGAMEESAKGQDSVLAGIPLFLLVVITTLMLQLRSFSRTLLVLLTAPLGMIGVTSFLLLFNQPFGFIAMLGTIALFGMIMRNSVILVDQIEQDIASGHSGFDAVVGATVRRFRPIVLTALAAVLAMVPLTRSIFFGPMATAIMGGLIAATALTLLFLPALYAAWFRIPDRNSHAIT